jgi:hypothetical protein
MLKFNLVAWNLGQSGRGTSRSDMSHTDGLDFDRRNRELAAAKSAEPRCRALPTSG